MNDFLQEKEDALYESLDRIKALEEPTEDDIKEAFSRFLEYLIEVIKNPKADSFLLKLKEKIEADRFGLFDAIFAAVKAKVIDIIPD